MRRLSSYMLALVAVTALATAGAAQGSSVIPGKAIGDFQLGETVDPMVSSLGPLHSSDDLPAGNMTGYYWPLKRIGVIAQKDSNRIVALVVSLDDSYKTDQGVGVGSDVNALRADRDEILQCLLHANLKLQEYDQDRTNFLARAVHDFRAPLTAIDGYCGLMLGQQLGPITEEQQEVLERMQHSIKRLSRMATAMFQLSVGRQIEKRPNLEKGDIDLCINQALHEITPFSEAKHIHLSVQMMPSSQVLYFDREQIEQVLINLLDNACKFTPKYGSIEVRGYPFFWERRAKLKTAITNGERRTSRLQAPNSFRIDICDSGPGVPVENLDKIFEEYTSYSGGQDRSGGGLGLAICKFILNLHQGQVWAEAGEDGSRFSFVLPFIQHEAQLALTSEPPHQLLQAGA